MKNFLKIALFALTAVVVSLVAVDVGPAAAAGTAGVLTAVGQATGLIDLPTGVALVSFTGFKRKARGGPNLGGLVKIWIISEDDVTAPWPTLSAITAGEITTAPTLAVGKFWQELTADIDTSGMKSSRKGDLGYHGHNHEGGAKFAGYDKTQHAGVESTLNCGGLVVGQTADGSRYVAGSTVKPCNFEHEVNLGNKSDDKLHIDLTWKATGLPFGLVPLGSAVLLPTGP